MSNVLKVEVPEGLIVMGPKGLRSLAESLEDDSYPTLASFMEEIADVVEEAESARTA